MKAHIFGYDTVLAIDFDGVVHDHKHKVPGQRLGNPIKGAKDALTTLKRRRNTIIIHSARAVGDNVQMIAAWLKLHNIPYDDITNIKPQAEWYLDDKAMHFSTWDDCKLVV